jgi:proteasome accessory factor A
MTARRVMGIETEYGIVQSGDPSANPTLLSSQIVNSYPSPGRNAQHRARWDYENEAPLRDARGWEASRGEADPSQLTDTGEELGLANVILTNGARLYVDHAHPEFSTPEVTNPRDAVVWDKAGERVMLDSVRRIATTPGLAPVNLYKNNTDGKGSAYGTHENFLMSRLTPFGRIVRHLIPFLVSRQVIAGAGRVGLGQDGSGQGFQISQRADFFEVEVGLETTLKRPIINTRDEPHALAEKFRRLHVIIGDATMSEVSTFLKMGTTAIVLELIEQQGFTRDLTVDHPVSSLHAVSHDPGLSTLLTLAEGGTLTAVHLQWAYFEQAAAFLRDRYGTDLDPVTAEVMSRWESVLTRLERDPFSCAGELDWVAKWQLLEGFRDRENLEWTSPRLALIDLQWSDIRPEKGLYHRLVARGRMERLLTDEQIDAAVTQPPEDTRAYFRGRCLSRFAAQVNAASWDSVVFDLPGRESLQRVSTPDPLRGTREHVEKLFDRAGTATELLDALSGS